VISAKDGVLKSVGQNKFVPLPSFLRATRLLAGLMTLLACAGSSVFSQTLNVPPRATNALTGGQFVSVITPLSAPPPPDRENWIYAQVASGNVPSFMRNLVAVTTNSVIGGINHTVTYYVTPDYMAIGSDADYFLEPMTPLLAQRLADLLGCSLPTRKMVNDIWTKAVVKLSPAPIPPSAAMTTVPVFDQHNSMVRTQRLQQIAAHPLGALVGGDKKDVIISTLIYNNLHGGVPKPVVIYGWHQSNGSPIQQAYNGHEETYADYSHGIRFVQNAIMVDGAANTIASILTNTVLHPLLSDEGVIALLRYPVAAVAPVIIAQPYSCAVKPGATVNFSVQAAGYPAVSYLWKFNGTTITGATNGVLLLTNVQATNAGSYTVVVSNASNTATSRAAVLTVSAVSYPILFGDDFDTNSAANWNLFWGAGDGVPDYTVDWAFDYRTVRYAFSGTTNLIPPAPSTPGTSTKGVKFTINNNDASGVIAGVNIYPKNKSFTGNFALKFDLWINYPGGAGGTNATGSTQHAICVINHLGTEANWAATTATATDGIWFGAAGEGGTSRDYRAYVGNAAGVQTELSLLSPASSGISETNSTATIYQTLFPATRFESAGAPGKNWVAVELSQVNGTITWKMNGTVVAQRANSTSFTNGNIMFGFMDLFPSIASPEEDAFVIFDNVRVED
jgi:hypothetical protein